MRNHWKRSAYRMSTLVLLMGVAVMPIAGCGNGDEGILGTTPIVSAPGSRAADFLRASDYTGLVIEVQSFEGMQPTQETIDNLSQFLLGRLNKPGGVMTWVAPQWPASGKSTFSLDEIRQIEALSRSRYPEGQTLAAYVLMVDGASDQSSGNMRILGHAYGATSIVIYQSEIVELSGGIGEPRRDVLETTVMNHEFGHLLGLVANGSPTVDPGHHDQGNGAHCTNSSCLMHFSVDVSDVIANLLGGSVPTLDADCVNDLQSNGGK